MKNNLIKLANKFAVKYGYSQKEIAEGINYKNFLVKIANDRNISTYLKNRGFVSPTNYLVTISYIADGNNPKNPIKTDNFEVLLEPVSIDTKFIEEKYKIDLSDFEKRSQFIEESQKWIADYLIKNHAANLDLLLNNNYKTNISFKKNIDTSIFPLIEDKVEVRTSNPITMRIGIVQAL